MYHCIYIKSRSRMLYVIVVIQNVYSLAVKYYSILNWNWMLYNIIYDIQYDKENVQGTGFKMKKQKHTSNWYTCTLWFLLLIKKKNVKIWIRFDNFFLKIINTYKFANKHYKIQSLYASFLFIQLHDKLRFLKIAQFSYQNRSYSLYFIAICNKRYYIYTCTYIMLKQHSYIGPGIYFQNMYHYYRIYNL